jgi:hypothetical protein
MTENTSPNLGHRFQKGESGNPAGKPKGARHKTTLLAEKLMQDDVEKIVNAVLTAARNGDMMAAKIILDRIAPVGRSSSFDLPRIEGWDDVGAARAGDDFFRILRAMKSYLPLWLVYRATAPDLQDRDTLFFQYLLGCVEEVLCFRSLVLGGSPTGENRIKQFLNVRDLGRRMISGLTRRHVWRKAPRLSSIFQGPAKTPGEYGLALHRLSFHPAKIRPMVPGAGTR